MIGNIAPVRDRKTLVIHGVRVVMDSGSGLPGLKEISSVLINVLRLGMTKVILQRKGVCLNEDGQNSHITS